MTTGVPCAEVLGGAKIEIDQEMDPRRAGWQRIFRGYGDAVVFNALPLTFDVGGQRVASVVRVRREGDDWWGLVVPEPMPRTADEADQRFGVDAGVGAAMRDSPLPSPTAIPVAKRRNRWARRAIAARGRGGSNASRAGR